ncbi:hypothetical protein A2V61_04325 [Candidatus Woesebacteria bacterium RBG_19FT_COMBO_47_8]|uniref:Uncharacterized protein n=1 Tax=Candidatus Woesebacteria bacterium RBG_13_46_13 TaxID=1802479 RepID=A0A1F7X3G4_9BACT|nr:MAG: hypothetical protein A2Y68_00420 [Candidatus Woesebacteria bacterium RBG_13_46_13]OGM16451.1 MAG: hypothetical protein A2V61_04325 [Candidatus Woesebacteria bacterium RBG_19FT_COMBO_47_8]HJX59033.1 hypothetical protein [Patescibacteria group bacterium]
MIKISKLLTKTNIILAAIFLLGKDKVVEDKAIGAFGLIYPDAKDYPLEVVKQSCSSDNINLTEPMFGYTQ